MNQQSPEVEPGRGASARRRRLGLVCVALLATAAALVGSSALTWFAADVPAPGRAPVRVAVRGAEVVAGLDGVALLALAGVAAVAAVAGPARRVLGLVLTLAGGWLGVAVAAVVARPPTAAEVAASPAAPSGAGVPAEVSATAAPWLAAGGVLFLVVAGGVVLLAEPGLPRLGARYAAPAAARDAEPDPDRAAWDALDTGRDPTRD